MSKKKLDKISLQVSIETENDTGEILAVYFHIRKGTAATVVERENGAVFINYDKNGRLLGVEMLAPCAITVLDSIAQKEPFSTRSTLKKFLRNSVPRKMVAAA